jgi:hypothetical protein
MAKRSLLSRCPSYLYFDILFYLIDFLLQWKIVMLTSVATGKYMAKTKKTSIRMVIPQAENGKQDLLTGRTMLQTQPRLSIADV